MAAQRTARFPAYNALTLPLKAFAVTAITTATFIIGADAASRKFELAKYAIGSGTKLEADAYRAAEAEKMAGISEEGRAPIDLRTLSTVRSFSCFPPQSVFVTDEATVGTHLARCGS